MEYIMDTEQSYLPRMLKHLEAYNLPFTGNSPSETTYIYVLDKTILVGALTINLAWDWFNIKELFYVNTEVFQLMMAKVCDLYKGNASGIRVNTNISTTITDLKRIGFEVEGVLKKSEITSDFYSMIYCDFALKSNSKLDVLVSKNSISTYSNILVKEVSKLKPKYKQQSRQEELIFVALDKSKFVGGVKVIIHLDSVYIDIMVVKEAYRRQSIGSMLIDLVETEAKKRNLYSIFLETVLAKDFYTKLGYTIVSTKQNQPKGFSCYTLIKKINDK